MLGRLREEAINAIPAIIYFCIAFNLIHFTLGLDSMPAEVRYYSYLGVTVGALVIGKILIIVNTLPFVNLFPNRPLAYNIVWKFFLYSFFILLFRTIEAYLHLLYKYQNFSVAGQFFKFTIVSSHFWAVQMWLFLVFFVFVVFAEFTRVLGKDKVKQILFG
jgi:hypothetical protein